MGPGAPKALRCWAACRCSCTRCAASPTAPSVGVIVVAAPAADIGSGRGHARRRFRPTSRSSSVAPPARRRWRPRSLAVPAEFDFVLVHDAARALTPPDLFEAVAAALRAGARAVIPVLPVADTIKRVDDGGDVVATVDRRRCAPSRRRRASGARCWSRPMPRRGRDAHRRRRHGRGAGPYGSTRSPGSERAFKITRPFDLVVAEALLAAD